MVYKQSKQISNYKVRKQTRRNYSSNNTGKGAQTSTSPQASHDLTSVAAVHCMTNNHGQLIKHLCNLELISTKQMTSIVQLATGLDGEIAGFLMLLFAKS